MFKSKESGSGEGRGKPIRPDAHRDEGSALIASGSSLRGDLKTPGAVSVDGRVEGNICAEGDVWIGPLGSVEGEVEGRNITVAGTVKGKIFAEDKASLLSGSHIEGDIHAQSLKVEDSVFFQGGCIMGKGARERRSDQSIALPAPLQAASDG